LDEIDQQEFDSADVANFCKVDVNDLESVHYEVYNYNNHYQSNDRYKLLVWCLIGTMSDYDQYFWWQYLDIISVYIAIYFVMSDKYTQRNVLQTFYYMRSFPDLPTQPTVSSIDRDAIMKITDTGKYCDNDVINFYWWLVEYKCPEFPDVFILPKVEPYDTLYYKYTTDSQYWDQPQQIVKYVWTPTLQLLESHYDHKEWSIIETVFEQNCDAVVEDS
jgi:hypothetical protein